MSNRQSERWCRCGHLEADHLSVARRPCVCGCLVFEEWPTCPTPDCGNKQCNWSGTVYCYPCAMSLLGPEEMIRRWNATHPDPLADNWKPSWWTCG